MAADSQRKPDNTAHSLFKAVLEQLTAAEAQKLQALVETVVHEVFGRLRVPQDYYVNFLRRAARKIRGIVFSGCVKTETPPDHHQEMEMLAKELVATVLESLGDRLESKASEPKKAARQKEQPVDGRASLVDKSKEAEAASSDIAHLHACLDKLTRQVVKNVRCLLKSMVASQFEGDSSCEYTKILELPKGKVSNRQMQPAISGASEGHSPEASTGVKLPALGPQPQAEGTGCAKTMEPENPATVKGSLVGEVNPATSGNTLDIRTMANRIVQPLLDQIGHHGPAPIPRQNFQIPVPNPTTSQGGEESCTAEGTPPSVDRQFSRQPIPPEGPKLPAQTRAWHRSVNPKLV
ncbi:fibrous sheath-interacting protein 2 isoform X1 [Turdus rufiventris]|nr:fibrous sheath-interacting protein 2 isoform X1 [Turdus rufiventris]